MKGKNKKETNDTGMYIISGGKGGKDNFGQNLHFLFLDLLLKKHKIEVSPSIYKIVDDASIKERVTTYKNFIYNRMVAFPNVPVHDAKETETDVPGTSLKMPIVDYFNKFILSKTPSSLNATFPNQKVEQFLKDNTLFNGTNPNTVRDKIISLMNKPSLPSSPITPPHSGPKPSVPIETNEKAIKEESAKINVYKDTIKFGTLNILIIDSDAKTAPEVVFNFLTTLLNPLATLKMAIGKVYYDDASYAVMDMMIKKIPIVTSLVPVRLQNDYTLLEEPPMPPINLVIRVPENNEKRKLSTIVYFESLISKPFLIERVKDGGKVLYNGELYKSNPVFASFNNVQNVMSDFTAGKHIDFKSRKEHNDVITKYLTDAKKIAQVTQNNLDPKSSDFLGRYLYEINLTEQQEVNLQQDFAISEYLQQLQNTVTDKKKIKTFERIAQDPSFATIWNDVSAIPNKINMLVLTNYVDYDILFVLLKLLEFTKHRLENIYIPTDAYDEKYFEELKLEKGTIAKIKALDDGGLYTLLKDKFSVNLVLDLNKGRKDYNLSEVLISYHNYTNKREHPNLFYLNDKNQIDFKTKFNVFNFFKGDEALVQSQVQDVYKRIVGSLKERELALKNKTLAGVKKYNDTLDIDLLDKGDEGKSLSTQVNDLVTSNDKLVNDFNAYVDFYKLGEITLQEQNKFAVEDIQKQISVKEDNEFYQIAQTLSGQEGLVLLEPLKKLDANIDLLILNNVGIDFVALIRDILAVFRLKVNTVYVKKQNSTDELTSILKPRKEVGYSNIYEIMEKNYNVNLVINGSTQTSLEENLSNSQINVLQDIVDKKKRVYIGLEKNDTGIVKLDVKDTLPLELASKANKTNAILKRFFKLSSGKKIGDQLVDFNEVVAEIELSRKDDPDLGYFLDKSTAQPVKQDVFTDDMKALVTLLQDRENQKLSENIMSNLDKFRNELKNAPKDNIIAIMGFTEAFSTFEIAIQTTRVMLKGVERNITKVFNKEASLDIELNRMLPNVVPYNTYDDLKKGNVTFIVKGDAKIDASFVLFLKFVEKPNLIVMIYDFEKQVVNVMTASQIIKQANFAPEELDSLYSTFNAVEAIKSKIAALNANGKAYIEQKQNQFNMVKYVEDLTELNGITETFGLGDTAKRELSMIIAEYKDALTGIQTMKKAKGSVYEKIYKIKQAPDSLQSLPSSEQIQIKDIIRVINDAFLDNVYTTPESLKFKGLVQMIENDFESFQERKMNNPELASRTLDHYFSHKFIQTGKENYESKIRAIKNNPGSIQYRKLKVLRNLFDTVYRLEFAQNALKDIGKLPKKKNFQRLSIFPRQNADIAFYYEQDALYTYMRTGTIAKTGKDGKLLQEPYLVAVSEQIVKMLIEKNQTINKTQVNIVDTITGIMMSLANDNGISISNCQSAIAIKKTLSYNVMTMFTEVLGINWLTDQRFTVSEKMKKAFSPKSLDLHIIPSVVALEDTPLVLSYGYYDIPKSTVECKEEGKQEALKGGELKEEANATVVVKKVNKDVKIDAIKEVDVQGARKDIANIIPKLTLKDDDFGKWFMQCNKAFKTMIYKGSTDNGILTQRIINKGKEFIVQQLIILMKEDEIVLMEDIFNQVLGVSKELRMLGSSLSPILNALDASISNMNKILINKEIANQYNINLEFQKELTEKQMWLHVLLVFNDIEGVAKRKIEEENRIIQRKFDLELDKYEQICESLKKNQLFLDQSSYANALLERKEGKNSTIPGVAKQVPTVVAVDDATTIPSSTPIAMVANSPEVDDTASPIVATKEPEMNAPVSQVIDSNVTIVETPVVDSTASQVPPATEEPEKNAPISQMVDNNTIIVETPVVETPVVETPVVDDSASPIPATIEPDTNAPVSKTVDSNATIVETPIVEKSVVVVTPPVVEDTAVPIPTTKEPETDTLMSQIVDSNTENINTLAEPVEGNTSSPSEEGSIASTKDIKLKQDGGALGKDMSNQLAGIEGSEFMRVLEYIFDDTKLRQTMKTLFESKGTIQIKSANIPEEREGFQFGGGFMDFMKKSKSIGDVTATSSIPEFKKPQVKQSNDIVLPSATTTDFASGLKNVVKDEEFEKLLVTINKKFLKSDATGSAVELEKLYFDQILKENPEIGKFIDISKYATEESLTKEINALNLRSFLSAWLKDSGYDISRISKQIKSKRLDLDERQPNLTVSSQESPKVEAKAIMVDNEVEVSFAKQNDKIQDQEYSVAANKQYIATEKRVEGQEMKQEILTQNKFSNLVSNLGFSSPPTFVSRNIPSLGKTHAYILQIIDQLDNFSKKAQRKHAKWIDELNAMLSQGEVSMSVQIQNKVNMLGSGKLLEIERRKVSIQLQYLIKKIIRAIDDKSTVNYSNFKDFFFTEKRRQIKDLMKYLEAFAYLKEDTFKNSFTNVEEKRQAEQLQKMHNEIETTFSSIIDALHMSNKSFYATTAELIETSVAEAFTINMRDKERAQVLQFKKLVLERMEGLPEKIKYFYTLNYPITEMFDIQFLIMYVIKALRVLSYQFSMNMATNIFLQKYESTVYDKKVNPPSLVSFMLIFLGFDLFFNAFILVTLGLCGFLFKTENNAFPIDKYLFMKYAFDYATTTTVIMVIGILIGSVIKQKRYFRYKTEGERGIRAFEEIAKMFATVITLIPMFMLIA
jgi:hypothetical protein